MAGIQERTSIEELDRGKWAGASGVRLEGSAALKTRFSKNIPTAEGPIIPSMGQYLDVFVRCPDGRWRMKERHLSREGAHKSMQDRPAG